jgi:hypothetical protein
MNERIKELYEQSWHSQFVPGVRCGEDITFTKFDYEKFAELIVRECVAEIEFQYGGGRELEDGTHSPDWDKAIECVSAMVRQHFGVEE